MQSVVVAAVVLVELHSPSGHTIHINPAEVSSMRAPIGGNVGHWKQGTKCILVMSNGRVNAVIEDCATVLHKLEASSP